MAAHEPRPLSAVDDPADALPHGAVTSPVLNPGTGG